MGRKTLPQGRLNRITQLARAGAGTGLGLITGGNPEKLAERATTILSSLRGLAAKVGQMASTVEGVLPERLEAPFANAMARLQRHTDASSPAEIQTVIEEQLGAPLSKLFAEFDPSPMASASIGQVHRAVLKDGQKVAVKVQHPGIDCAMQSDLSNVRLLERLVGGLVPRGFDIDRVFDEVSDRFREELDYRIEAEHQNRQAALHARTAGVVVPAVIETHTARKVLTTSLVEGRSLEQVLSDASPADRASYASTLWRFVFRSILVGGEFNTDPHAGNYIFQEPPNIAVLDFGCVQRLSETRRRASRRVHQAATMRDEPAFAEAVHALLGTQGGTFEAMALKFSRQAFSPIFESPYRVTSEFLRSLFDGALSSKTEVLHYRGAAIPFPPELALMNRLQFGFYSLLAKLDVTVDYAALQREILEEG